MGPPDMDVELTEASNAGVYEKLAILDEYLIDHC